MNPSIDPSDYGVTYVAWTAGLFLSAIAVARFSRADLRNCGLTVLGGFLLSVAIYAAVLESNLAPLGLIWAAIVGAPPSLLGAYLGKIIARAFSR